MIPNIFIFQVVFGTYPNLSFFVWNFDFLI